MVTLSTGEGKRLLRRVFLWLVTQDEVLLKHVQQLGVGATLVERKTSIMRAACYTLEAWV